MTRALILAAGEGTRWMNHLGAPKHFIVIDGETLLDRTIRLLHERCVEDVVVVGPKGDDRYQRPGARLVTPDTDPSIGIDKFQSSADLWNTEGRTVLLWGDVFFTDAAMDTILGEQRPSWWAYNRLTPSEITGCRWGEFFAVTMMPADHVRALVTIRHCGSLQAAGMIDRSGGFEWYRAMCGIVGPKVRTRNHVDLGSLTQIDDETDDFDLPSDYVRWMRNCRPGQLDEEAAA